MTYVCRLCCPSPRSHSEYNQRPVNTLRLLKPLLFLVVTCYWWQGFSTGPKGLTRVPRNPQGSTPSFRGVPVVRFETCAHGARMWQPENLTRRCLQPTDARRCIGDLRSLPCGVRRPAHSARSCPVCHRRVYPGGTVIPHYPRRSPGINSRGS